LLSWSVFPRAASIHDDSLFLPSAFKIEEAGRGTYPTFFGVAGILICPVLARPGSPFLQWMTLRNPVGEGMKKLQKLPMPNCIVARSYCLIFIVIVRKPELK
jgi:hypothetical protein